MISCVIIRDIYLKKLGIIFVSFIFITTWNVAFNNTGQQRFWPMRKNVCFWCTFGGRIRMCFYIFSITHTFYVGSDYVTAHAYVCDSLGVCRRESGHVVRRPLSRVIPVWLTVLCRLLARAQCVIVSEVRSVCSTSNMPRTCVNSSDAFCYICGDVIFKFRTRSFKPLIKKRYELYFGCKVGDQDKSWAPHICCVICVGRLAAWAKVHAVCLAPFLWFGESPRTMFQIAILPDQYHCCNNKVRTHCSTSKVTICDKASTSQCGFTCEKISNVHDAEWQWIKW
jgi:hypothetical protein